MARKRSLVFRQYVLIFFLLFYARLWYITWLRRSFSAIYRTRYLFTLVLKVYFDTIHPTSSGPVPAVFSRLPIYARYGHIDDTARCPNAFPSPFARLARMHG